MGDLSVLKTDIPQAASRQAEKDISQLSCRIEDLGKLIKDSVAETSKLGSSIIAKDAEFRQLTARHEEMASERLTREAKASHVGSEVERHLRFCLSIR